MHALCMLCAKKTIFIIEKNTTILQSMFVINKMTQWMTVGLRGNRVWNEGFCSCIPTPFSHFYPALFFIAFWNPIFCLPSILVESLCMMEWKEKSGRNEEKERRVFPPLSLLPSPQCFSCSLFFAPPPVFEHLNRLFSGARRLV